MSSPDWATTLGNVRGQHSTAILRSVAAIPQPPVGPQSSLRPSSTTQASHGVRRREHERYHHGVLLATYLCVALTILCSCQPFHHFWQVSPDPGRLCQATNSPVYVLVVLITNIITDLYLLSIPLPVRDLWSVPGEESFVG